VFRQFANLSHVHLIGVGGAGMSGIAEVLSEYDLAVSGCDKQESEIIAYLRNLGVEVSIGHSPEHLDGVDVVVASSAIDSSNPELAEARDRGIAVVPRAEMLAELMRLKYGIAVAGTHGKTTTTSLVGTVLTDAQMDPTVIVGGRLRVSGTGARLGKSEYMVAEADEFDRSFLRLQPIVAVITSIDADHLDTYRDIEEIRDAFVTFATKVPFFGEVIVCLDDPNVQLVLPRLSDHRLVTYGFSPQADLSIVDLETTESGSSFGVMSASGNRLGDVELPMPGRHNAQNALAAIAVGLAVGLDFDLIAKSLGRFKGVHRRFERLGTWLGAEVIDDYAHHPAEVRATLQAARSAYPAARIHAVFQPHLFSRTLDQAEEFGRALLGADRAIVTAIYPSREDPIEGVDSNLVIEAAKRSGHRHVTFCEQWANAGKELAEHVGPGDVILTLGAGDIYRLGEMLAGEGAQ
jgi:UDP-N-acetylmuramate--alanine ligase